MRAHNLATPIISSYKIIWIARAFWLVYKCVFITLWSTKIAWAMWFDCLRVVRISVPASYIVFLFVNNENNDFIKEIKDVLRASIACWKPWQSLWEFSSKWKPSTASRLNSQHTQLRLGFSLICSRILPTFASVFTRLWRHGEHVLFLKYRNAGKKRENRATSPCSPLLKTSSSSRFGCMSPFGRLKISSSSRFGCMQLFWKKLHCRWNTFVHIALKMSKI